jgi:hypothetical protein
MFAGGHHESRIANLEITDSRADAAAFDHDTASLLRS